MLAGMAVVVVLGACGGGSGDSSVLRISGSTTVNAVAADAAEVLRAGGLTITVDASGGSAGGIAQLGAGQVEIAMSSKPLADSDREQFPDADFVTTEIGQDAVGIIVRRNVYDGGVTNLTKDQVKALFEGRVANWSELGGPDVPVFVYDKEPGR
ncbi:MAG TPA: substrate-binding domain-containing protein, partial [Acidimicrobiales bacterium]